MAEQEMTAPVQEEFEPIMPAGWTEGSDIFNPSSYGGNGFADAQDKGTDTAEEETSSGELADYFRTTENSGGNGAESTDSKAGSPTTGAGDQSVSQKLRFRATLDHTAQDVELDEADLPSLWQKAQVLDRYQARLQNAERELSDWDHIAKQLSYSDRGAMRDGVIENAVAQYTEENPGVPADMARDYIIGRFKRAGVEEPSTEVKQAEIPTENENVGRDFKAEVAELFSTYPQSRLEEIPNEVTTAAITEGKPLVRAYADYVASKATREAQAIKKENEILKQNQASAARAPVSGVSKGGATDTKSSDAFLQGFNADTW